MSTWVLLRGLMRDHRHWHGFDQRLRDKGLFVLTPDLAGNGSLVAKTSPTNIQDYAAEVWRQIEASLALARRPSLASQPIYLVGLSMGGMLAMTMAQQHPERIAHVFILNSSAANLSGWYARFNIFNVIKAFICRKRGEKLNAIEATIVRLTSYRHGRDYQLILQWSQFRRQQQPSIYNACRQLWAAFRYQSPTELASPVTIICGDRDALVSIQSNQALARHFNCELMVLAYCGHDIALDAPAKLAHYLTEIIRVKRFF